MRNGCRKDTLAGILGSLRRPRRRRSMICAVSAGALSIEPRNTVPPLIFSSHSFNHRARTAVLLTCHHELADQQEIAAFSPPQPLTALAIIAPRLVRARRAASTFDFPPAAPPPFTNTKSSIIVYHDIREESRRRQNIRWLPHYTLSETAVNTQRRFARARPSAATPTCGLPSGHTSRTTPPSPSPIRAAAASPSSLCLSSSPSQTS